MGGLVSMSGDEGFVSATKKEIAAAMHMPVTQMEDLAQGIFIQRSGSAHSGRKRRPIPNLPCGSFLASEETVQPDPAVRRKRRPVPMVPSVHHSEDADSNV